MRQRYLALLTILLAVAGGAPAVAGDWSFDLQGIFMDAYGHDQHVLTVRELDPGSAPPLESATAVKLDTQSGLAYRGELQYRDGPWGFGLDFFWFSTSQDVPDRTTAAAGPLSPVAFEIADQAFGSTGPGQVLFYDLLEDTDLAVWTVDLYALRTLAESPASALRLQLGLRIADFDNDYRAVVGLVDVRGTRLDASSNYGMMLGPIVGLAGEIDVGKSTFEAYLGQSVLLGSAELSSMSRQFFGPFGETPAFFAQELFRADEDVAIPVSEVRLAWRYQATRHLSFGVGADASAWLDVPVPPGVIPGFRGDRVLHENTIVFYGLGLAVGLTF